MSEFLSDKITKNSKCADYFFPEDQIIVELKTLNQNHGARSYVLELIRHAALRFGHSSSVVTQWEKGLLPLPEDIQR